MRVFKTKAFDRFARRERITDDALREAAYRADHGEIDADLGGGVLARELLGLEDRDLSVVAGRGAIKEIE